MIRVENHDHGPRLWVAGRRIHHFHFGLACIALGVAAIARDWDDFLTWVVRP